MLSLRDQGTMTMMLDIMDYFKGLIIGIFMMAMAIVLWNSGLLGGLAPLWGNGPANSHR